MDPNESMEEIISNPSDPGNRSPPLVSTPPQAQVTQVRSLREALEEVRMPPEVPLPEEEMLPNAPLVDLPVPEGPRQPYREFPKGEGEEEVEVRGDDFEERGEDDEDYRLHDTLLDTKQEDPLHGQPLLRAMLGIFEIMLVSVLLMLPSLLLLFWKRVPRYSLIAVKHGPQVNGWMEFVRWSAFLTLSYDFKVLADMILQNIPTALVALAKRSPVRWKPFQVRLLLALKGVKGAMSIFLWLLGSLWVGALLLYTPQLTGTQALATKGIGAADALRLAEQEAHVNQWESLLVGGFIFALCLAIEKYFLRFVAFKLHRSVLEGKIDRLNQNITWIERLDRATSNRTRRLLKRPPAMPQGTGELEVPPSKHAALQPSSSSAATRAEVTGTSIFNALTKGDKEQLEPEDFRSILGESDYYAAWLCFDPAKEHALSREAFCRALRSLYEERDRVEANQVSNGLVLFRFDAILMLLVGFFGLMPLLWLALPMGYAWVLTAGLLVVSLFVILRDLVQKVFNGLLFVFVEQAYQVGEFIWWEGQRHLVTKIGVFATHLLREDGTRGHLPTAVISPKNIINLTRNPCHRDQFTIVPQGRSNTLGQLQALKKPLDEWLRETFNEYTGKCEVRLTGDQIELDLVFNPILDVTGEAVAARRASLKQKIVELMQSIPLAGELSN